ncbi:MAG: hypothetical protein ABEJ43_06185 [Haloferacaceae archaeon]
MELQTSFDVLSAVIDGYESRGLPVETVDATTVDADEGDLRATVEVAAPLAADGFAAESAVVTQTGDVRVEFSAGDQLCRPASRPGVVSATVDSVRVADEGIVAAVVLVVDPAESVPESASPAETVTDGSGDRDDRPADEAEDAAETVTDGSGDRDDRPADEAETVAAVRDESVPPFEDTAYLRRLYEQCDTFAAMARLFETDVSAETVRRYTIEAGIHDPDSYATDQADAPAEDVDVPDDLPVDDADVPDDLTVGAVADAVVDARTSYEVGRRIGLDQDRTRDLLRRLDLLDLVTSRIDAAPDRRASPEEVAARIRQCASGSAYPADG